ncbi:molybdopterin molybdotransferase MoeA [Roseiconus nitratireducens]|uniref:Molybdopterin molybdenumtransferase n=1 Tax=Roseiconus nitratireducens TaxID=2605748 RepID=A0A5M6D0S8_9BACT|nr:molybdopterin molybdotransferase MoeA [Roseiconus nitratireducens]KAA5541108.1 molybdopterin molybdotransferase MoeA [Roseiconus nitratireducens]
MSQSFTDPDSALQALADRIATVSETVRTIDPLGAILALPVRADRDSPAADVSAMDGYAIRLSDLRSDVSLPVTGESSAGSPPPALAPGSVIRIFTGAIIPEGCEAVVKREDTRESADAIRFTATALKEIQFGSNIRRAGENAAAGSEVLPAGQEITPAAVASLVNFGCVEPIVYRPAKVGIITTGDEVVDPNTDRVQPWQLRNSNRAAIQALLTPPRFVELTLLRHVHDDREGLKDAISQAVDTCDAVVLTGGVSKGDYDYVPEIVAASGGEIIFHGLPIRPGKPILGATTAGGKLILGLPGNPVSATINAHRFLWPLVRRIAGLHRWRQPLPQVTLSEAPRASIPLHAMLLVRMLPDGTAALVPSKGSGDLVALGQSDGYVCVPPATTTTGPWPIAFW